MSQSKIKKTNNFVEAAEIALSSLTMLTTAQAAERLGTTAEALRVRRFRGEGPPYAKLGARTIRYPVLALETWIQARLIDPEVEKQRHALALDQLRDR